MKLIVLTGVIGLFAGCNKEDIAKGTPTCMENKIKDIAGEEIWDPPAKVFSYTYNGGTVFYIPPRCCDIPSELYDEDCNFICSPDGGISGEGDGQCPDFFTARTDEKLIWQDTRE